MLLAAGVRTTDLPAVRAGLDRAVRTGLRRVTAGTVGGAGSVGGAGGVGGFGVVDGTGSGGVGKIDGPTGGAGRDAALDPVHRGRALHDLRRMLQVVDQADLWWVSAAAGREVTDHPVDRRDPGGVRGPGRPGAGTLFPAPSGLLLWEGPTGLTLQVTGGRRRVVTDDGLPPDEDRGWPVCGVLWFRVEGKPVVVPLSERTAPGSRHRVAAAGPEDTLAGGYRRLGTDPPLADLLTGTWDALAAGRLATTVRRVVHRGSPVRRHEVHRAHHVAG